MKIEVNIVNRRLREESLKPLCKVSVAAERFLRGATPRIGANGNWWIEDEDTGVPARVPQPELEQGVGSRTDAAMSQAATTQAIDALEEKIDDIGKASVVVQEPEHDVGIWVDPKYGERRPLYESIISYEANEAVGPGTVIHMEVPGMILERDAYVRIVNTTIWKRGAYHLGRVTVADGGMNGTRIAVVFDSDVGLGDIIKIQMRYVKYRGDILTFTIKVPAAGGVQDMTIEAPKIKYFKKALFTPTCDDSNVTAYCNFWAFMNHRKVWNTAGKKYFHKGWTPGPDDTYILYDRPLDFDNGTGRRIRYSFGCAIWPNWGDTYNPYGRIKDTATSTYAMYICWDELREMIDYGISMMYHNVDERIYDKDIPTEIVKGFAEDRAKTYEKLGVWMKLLGQPDGNTAYIAAAQQTPLIQFMRQSAPTGAYIYVGDKQDLYHKNTYGGIQTSDRERKKTEIAAQIASENPYWVGITVHESAVGSVDYDFYRSLYDTYSASPATDRLWVASWDEVYEWLYVRDRMRISKSVRREEDSVCFDVTVHVPGKDSFDFRSISLLAAGYAGPSSEPVDLTGAEIVDASANIIKTEYASAENGALRINLNFDPKTLDRAEKYTRIFESTADELDKESALYFVGWLGEELAAPYLERIEAVRNIEIASLTVAGPDTLERHQSGTFVITAAPEDNTHMEQVEVSASTGMLLQSKQIEGNVIKAVFTATTVGQATVTAAYKEHTALHVLAIEEAPVPPDVPIESISIAGDDTIAGAMRKTYTITCLPANNTQMPAVQVTVAGGIQLVDTSVVGNVITVVVEASSNGAASIVAATDAVSQFKHIAVSGVEQTSFRIIASFGYDYKVPTGGIYDASGGYTKIRIAGAAATGKLYRTDGKVAGTYAYSGVQKQPGAANYGPVTGNDSGLYKDYAIQSFCYLDTTSPDDGVFECTDLVPGNYRVRFFLNVGNSNYSKQVFTVSYVFTTSEGSYPVVMPTDNDQLWYHNFDKYIDTEIIVGDDGRATFTIHRESAAQIACWQILDFEKITTNKSTEVDNKLKLLEDYVDANFVKKSDAVVIDAGIPDYLL